MSGEDLGPWIVTVALAGHAATQTAASSRVVQSLDDAALVPAGSFWMGAPEGEGDSDEHPRHRVHLGAFSIDKREVTVGQYQECVDAGGCTPPTSASARGALGWEPGVGCNWGNPRRGADHPVNCVDWDQADAYCRWAGKRLPTEAEWEKAARGGAWSHSANSCRSARRWTMSPTVWYDIIGFRCVSEAG